MSTERPGSYQRLLSAIHRADLLSRRVADQELIEKIGVGRATFLTLEMIADRPGHVSQQAAADALGLTKAAVSRQLRSAEEEGWVVVERAENSRRENAVRLTPAGRSLVARGRRLRALAERAAAGALGGGEMRAAAETIERLCEFLESRSRG